MGNPFTTESIRDHYREKIRLILDQGGGVEEIVN